MKKNSFWYTIVYYNIISFLLFAVGIILLRNYIKDIIYISFEMTERSPFFKLIGYGVDISLLIFWVYIVFTSTRDKRYNALTGRHYGKDHSDFQKNYSTLVSFFTQNDKYKMDVEELPIEDWHDADGVILCKYKDRAGHYRLVKRDSGANGNLVAFGLPGSGKSTTQAATTAARFNAKLKKGGCGVFAISIKGDLLNFVRDKRKNIKVFTPDKEEGSCLCPGAFLLPFSPMPLPVCTRSSTKLFHSLHAGHCPIHFADS